MIQTFVQKEICPSTRGGTVLRNASVLALALGLFCAPVPCRGQDAQAKQLMASAKAKQEEANKLRADAGVKRQEAANDEANASASEREARILAARALTLLKADANKQRAFQLRNESQQLWAEAHRKIVEARNARQRGEHCRADAEEFTKAAAEVKDQPGIADTLRNDAKAQTAQAQSLEQTVNTEKAAIVDMEKRAQAAWAEAEKLDPETHQALAAKPAAPEMRPSVPVKPMQK